METIVDGVMRVAWNLMAILRGFYGSRTLSQQTLDMTTTWEFVELLAGHTKLVTLGISNKGQVNKYIVHLSRCICSKHQLNSVTNCTFRMWEETISDRFFSGAMRKLTLLRYSPRWIQLGCNQRWSVRKLCKVGCSEFNTATDNCIYIYIYIIIYT